MTELPFGSITDVGGIAVGHHQRTGRGWQTGTTVVIARDGATPGVDVRGGGPGTRETDALAPQNLVERIDAVCLTGGSAYGLAAADGVVAWLEARGRGYPVGPADGDGHLVVPVVPAAVVFDLGRGGVFANRPDAGFGHRAAAGARRNQRRWGAVGAGTGATAGGLQGGVGTASMRVRIVTSPTADSDGGADTAPGDVLDVTVGALAVVNANGSVVDPATALPWEPSGLRLRRPVPAERSALHDALTGGARSRLNTTIGIVATDADLTKAESSKLAAVAHDGMARAVRPAHSMFDGDTVFALATGAVGLPVSRHRLGAEGSRHHALNALLAAAADTFAAACTHAVVAATSIGGSRAYLDICPSALR